MEVILKVAEHAITPTVYHDCWQLDLEWMHGDADGDSRRTLIFAPADLQKLKYFLAMYDAFSETDYLEDQAKKWLKKNTELSEDEIGDLAAQFGDDFYDGDMTADCSFGAQWVSAIVTYWDAEGKQFEVDWSVPKPEKTKK